jgi:hypothetical protein
MRGTDLQRHVAPRPDRIDRDDHRCACNAGALHGAEAKRATTDNSDSRSRTDRRQHL